MFSCNLFWLDSCVHKMRVKINNTIQNTLSEQRCPKNLHSTGNLKIPQISIQIRIEHSTNVSSHYPYLTLKANLHMLISFIIFLLMADYFEWKRGKDPKFSLGIVPDPPVAVGWVVAVVVAGLPNEKPPPPAPVPKENPDMLNLFRRKGFSELRQSNILQSSTN